MVSGASADRHVPEVVITGIRGRLLRWLPVVMEVLVLGLVIVPPWIFTIRLREAIEFVHCLVIAVLLGLWGLRILLQGQLTWQKCPVCLCLGAVLLLGLWQLTPLPRPVLAVVSPPTARLYDRMLPQPPETLPGGETAPQVFLPAGSTLSVYPWATRATVIQLLMLFAFFALVRHNLASRGCLARLSAAVLISAGLLSLVVLVQELTSWDSPADPWPFSLGRFGGFANRNDYAFHMNICLGLGVGLLLYVRSTRSGSSKAPSSARASGVPASLPAGERSAPRSSIDPESPSEISVQRHRRRYRRRVSSDPGKRRPGAGAQAKRKPHWARSLVRLLSDPAQMWIVLTLVLILAGVVRAQSRGAFLALLGALAICLPVYLRTQRLRVARLLPLLLILVGCSAATLYWMNFSWIHSRFSALWDLTFLDEKGAHRLPIWERAVRCAQEYPIWGTGYGTWFYMELPYKTEPEENAWLFGDFVHNQYLEAMVEGGIFRLALTLLGIALVWRIGYRALRRYRGRSAAALVLGALISFTAVVLHSLVDHPIRITANSLLMIVVVANLCALGARDSGKPSGAYTLRLAGLAPVAAAILTVLVALVCVTEAWRMLASYRFLYPYGLSGTDDDGRSDPLACLQTVARLMPGDARLQLEIGQFYQDRFFHQLRRQSTDRFLDPADAVFALAGPAPIPGPGAEAACWLARSLGRQQLGRQRAAQLEREYLVPALRHYLVARDLCPVQGKTQVRLAAHAEVLERGDPRSTYLERAVFLIPYDPELPYRCGLHELRDGHPDLAGLYWRRSLELSQRFAPDILRRSRELFTPPEILEHILPDNPQLLATAAWTYFPEAESQAQRRPFLEKSLELLDSQTRVWKADERYLKGSIHRDFGQPDEAIAAYRSALIQRPDQAQWRYELAELLAGQNRWADARHELLLLFRQQPDHPQGKRLWGRLLPGDAEPQ
jgi:O-antigen ligase/tetratricopeptide (TPR) repeat protein